MEKTFKDLSWAIFVLSLAGGLAGCAASKPQNKVVTASYVPGVPGGSYTETYQTEARVVAIDAVARKMVFQAPDRSTNTFQAGPEFQDFDSYKVGDKIQVVVARELVTWFAPETPPAVNDVSTLVRDQPGTKAGVLTAPTIELTAELLSVAPQKHEATLRLSDGRVVTFNVRKDIDLTEAQIGTIGLIRTSAAMAVLRKKP